MREQNHRKILFQGKKLRLQHCLGSMQKAPVLRPIPKNKAVAAPQTTRRTTRAHLPAHERERDSSCVLRGIETVNCSTSILDAFTGVHCRLRLNAERMFSVMPQCQSNTNRVSK